MLLKRQEMIKQRGSVHTRTDNRKKILNKNRSYKSQEMGKHQFLVFNPQNPLETRLTKIIITGCITNL